MAEEVVGVRVSLLFCMVFKLHGAGAGQVYGAPLGIFIARSEQGGGLPPPIISPCDLTWVDPAPRKGVLRGPPLPLDGDSL